MIQDVEKAIREYLPQIVHMSLATCVDNKPWVCELHFVFDQELNLYFRSTAVRRHSQEIAKNKNVAGTIVTQHSLEDKPRGVYFEGTAEMLDEITEDVFNLFEERFGSSKDILEESKKADGHKFFKITVNNFALFDSRESSPSKKYELPWRK